MNQLVSIIVPVYRVEKYLKTCIDSILEQTYKNLEIILIDDGSPDNCPKICDEYVAMDSRVVCIHKENGGLSDARNVGIDLMHGDYCTFVDSDDFLHKDAVQRSLNLAIQYNADIVQFGFDRGSNNYFSSLSEFESQVSLFNNITIFESKKNNIVLWGKMFRSSLWQDVRMPKGKLNEDDYTTWKLYYRAHSIVVSDTKLYYYTVNPNSTMSSLKKIPNISYPIEAYHERISFFDNIGEKHLSDLSKWRYSKYLMLSLDGDLLSDEQKTVLYQEFKGVYKDVLKCKKVPVSNKLLLLISLISPKLTGFVLKIVRR